MPKMSKSMRSKSIARRLIATMVGLAGAAQLLKSAGAQMVAASFVIDLPDLGGAARLRGGGIEVHSLLTF